MEIIDVKNFNNYIKKQTIKNKIVIHGTGGGTYTGALQTFITGESGVSTHFIISQDAKIYRLFSEKNYGYHAGANYRTISETSFGIEIVNDVNLVKKGDKFYTWYGKQIAPQDVCCTPMWRGHQYFKYITPQQHLALQSLLKYLCQKYNINKKLYRNYSINNTFNTKAFNGILFHSSFHPTRLDFQPHVIPLINI